MALWNETRFALRQLRKTPGSSLVIIATLALCIGANTSIYSVVDAILFRPLPYPDHDRLALVVTYMAGNGEGGLDTSQNGTQFESVRDSVPGIEVAAYGLGGGANFFWHGQARYIKQQRVSAGYFHVLGVPPQLGREFNHVEDSAGGPQAAIVSYGFWQNTLEADPKIIGKAIALRGEPYTVVGLMPRGFRADQPADVWTPLRPSRTGEGSGDNYGVIARLKHGVNWAAANAQLRALSAALRPPDLPKKFAFEERLVPLQHGLTYDNRHRIVLPWAAVLVVLLISCANIAGLLLARSASRRHEIATRLAVGASRWAVIRQLLVESGLLAVMGGAAGMLIGVFALDRLKALGAANLELWHPLVFDGRVFSVMAAATLLTTLFFGLIHALETARVDVRSVLVENDRGVAGPKSSWLRGGLIVCEIALSLVLLVSAGLLIRTLAWLEHQNPGFEPRNVLTAQTSLQDARYRTAGSINTLFRKGLLQISAIPGVQSAAVALTLPYERPLNDNFRVIDGIRQGQIAETVYATPEYFGTLKMRVIDGRGFRDSDTPESQKVIVVSESFATRYFGSSSRAIGGHLEMPQKVCEIVGVVADVQQHSGIGDFGPISFSPTIYVPAAQVSDGFVQMVHTWFSPSWVVRSNLPPGDLSAKLSQIILSIDPQLPVANFHSMHELQQLSTEDQRYQAVLFSSLAGLALLVSVIGLYAIIAQSVVQRTREMGIRMALGATARDAVGAVMKPGLIYALAGLVIGLGLSIASARLLTHLVWGIPALDPLTFAMTSILMLICAVLASLIPSLRLSHLDPSQTLRDQ
jgi:predicted permease